MPLSYHLIDGYNLLHAAGLARETYGPGDYERTRYALLAKIADGLDDASRERTVVVFDAFDPPPGVAPRFRFREMTVEFAVESGEADARIEHLIRRHSAPRQLRVVSDDIRLKQAAKRRGGAAVRCESFLRRLERFASSGRSSAATDRPADATDDAHASIDAGTGDWLSYFGVAGDELPLPDETAMSDPAPRATDPSPPVTNSGRPKQPNPPSKTLNEAVDEPPADDLAFWQRRIDEALAEERLSDSRRRESS
jgi:predicted RNA-binding protein with PIN domain